MNCPKCASTRITKADLNRSGSQRYQCMDCGRRFTPKAKKTGRKRVGDEPMSSTERSRRRRQKMKDNRDSTQD